MYGLDEKKSTSAQPNIINYWINNKINDCGKTTNTTSKRTKPKIK